MAPAAEAIVVAATTAEVLAAVPEAQRQRLLTDGERARAAAFHFDHDRDDFVAAHVLARGCASSVLDAPLHEQFETKLVDQVAEIGAADVDDVRSEVL